MNGRYQSAKVTFRCVQLCARCARIPADLNNSVGFSVSIDSDGLIGS